MKKILVMPVLAAVLFSAACGDDAGPTEIDTRASVRFFNATTGMTASGGFTANGQFASGSALAFGQTTCSKVAEGAASFGFGAANTAGTSLSGSALTTLDNQSISAGGSYTVVATGSAASPQLLLLSNSFSGELGTNQAAVRYVNLDAPSGTTVYNYVVYFGAIGATTPVALNLAFGVATAYAVVPSGAKTFSVLQTPGHTTVVENSATTLQGGSVNTMGIVRTSSGAVQLIHLPRCS
jgi:hypothetical protein